jgi:hypothetical protein
MMGAVTGSRFEADVVAFVERLAERLQAGGAAHPVAAAVALAARGRTTLDRAGYAGLVGLSVATVEAMEEGRVAFGDLPDVLVDWLEPTQLLQLAELVEASSRRGA